MTRFLFYTDLHLSAKKPRNRVDDYTASLLNKLKEIYQIAQAEKVDFVFFGGDFFDSYINYSYRMLIDAIELITVKTYAIIGQHDLRGYNRETIQSSSLGFLEYFCKNFVNITEPLEFPDAIIYPCHVYDDLIAIAKQSVTRKKKSILVAHKLICNKKQFFDTYDTAELECSFNLCLAGDFHTGFDKHEVKGVTYYNPGSIARKTTTDIGRVVRVALVEVELGKPITIREIPLKSARPSEEVFGESIIDEIKEKPIVNIDGFVDGITDIENEVVDVFELIEKVGKKQGIRKEVLEYIISKRH